ncbi:MAG: nucleotidyltransferase domain-containing protein [Dermatophilaceae bacterium]
MTCPVAHRDPVSSIFHGLSRRTGRGSHRSGAYREAADGAHSYTLNRSHLAAPAVLALANLRQELLDRIRTEVSTWAVESEATWMFGSAARGDADADSDIDLLFVRPTTLTTVVRFGCIKSRRFPNTSTTGREMRARSLSSRSRSSMPQAAATTGSLPSFAGTRCT